MLNKDDEKVRGHSPPVLDKSTLALIWGGASTLSAGIGVWLAIRMFNPKAFGNNFSNISIVGVLGFAFCMALPVAIAQWIVFPKISRLISLPIKNTWIWLLITIIGLMAIILPCLSVPLETFFYLPFMLFIPVIIPVIPGAILLGILQWMYLNSQFKAGPAWTWVLITVVGAGSGGVISGLLLWLTGFRLSIEVSWGMTVVLGISSLQGMMMLDFKEKIAPL